MTGTPPFSSDYPAGVAAGGGGVAGGDGVAAGGVAAGGLAGGVAGNGAAHQTVISTMTTSSSNEGQYYMPPSPIESNPSHPPPRDDVEAARRGPSPFGYDASAATTAARAGGTGRTPPPLESKPSISLLEHTMSAVGAGMSSPTNRAQWTEEWISPARRKTLISALYMSFFAMLGALLRIAMAQLFGEECRNPGTVGWLAAGEPLCVTANGEASENGGIIFSDLPANLLGSFIMGLMQSGQVLGLPVDVPVAWLSRTSVFQTWDIIQLAIKTGFCGSLTTFSSWNSEMVVLMMGTGDSNRQSQWIRALLGYLIGVETAVGSFVLGKSVATWIHGWRHAGMAQETVAVEEVRKRGVYIHRELPDFERRFLSDLYRYMEDPEETPYDATIVEFLQRWKQSTETHRRVGNAMLDTLIAMERCVLLTKTELPGEYRVAARRAGWDLAALEIWTAAKARHEMRWQAAHGGGTAASTAATSTTPEPQPFTIFFALLFVLALVIFLVDGVMFHNDPYNATAVTTRTMFFAALLAPAGALLRWRWASYNSGGWVGADSPWRWFPVGTLLANAVASVVSAYLVGREHAWIGNSNAVDVNFWKTGTLRAIKVGFAGSLSTVSTFCAETTFLMKPPTKHRGYTYVLISLGISCFLGLCVYPLGRGFSS